MWVELLKLEQVGVHATLFELGGHSLMAYPGREPGGGETLGVELSLLDLFANATVAGIARLVDLRRQGDVSAAPTMIARRPGMKRCRSPLLRSGCGTWIRSCQPSQPITCR